MAHVEPELLTERAAARRLGIGLRQLRAARERGELATYRVGAWRRVRLAEVRAWLEAQRETPGGRGGCGRPATG